MRDDDDRMGHKDAETAEELAYDLFTARGYRVYRIARGNPDTPDPGDLLIYKLKDGDVRVHSPRIVDVKHFKQWEGDYPWKVAFISANKPPNPDWLYLALDAGMTEACLIDMRQVPPDAVLVRTSTHPNGHAQEGHAVPVEYARFFSVDQVLHP